MRLPAGTLIRAEAILFDMDGTLIDTTAPNLRAWTGWAARHGLDPDAILRVCHGRRTIETVRMFAPPGLDAEAEARALSLEATFDTEGVFPVPGAPALLDALPRDRWAIVTSADRAMAEERLRQVGLPRPEILIAAEDVSAGKPDPECYRLAARLLGRDPRDTLVFEDAPAGFEAGRAAGARTLAVATTLTEAELAEIEWITDFERLSLAVADGLRLTVI
ncbi:HAD family hydrolase [Azospirillum sp. SYSU D00513]|uniref:HAD family hydrolase n=1 Tax=Azospirillum sp. SYSU D00513 TaxID=2812561 RepID=UPI001A95F121|nr:HAD family hydrolase [Azospirillum sp. SYSU D00513]